MIISETTTVRWNGKNKNHFVEKGYEYTKLGDYFEAKVEDLMPKSRAIVEVACDYCGEVSEKKYFHIMNKRESSIVNKDCCPKCTPLKVQEGSMIKYGIPFAIQTDAAIKKRRQTCMEKYGVEYFTQTQIFKDKTLQTNMKRYGFSNHTKTKEYREKYSKEGSPHWKGGPVSGRTERNGIEYRDWRTKVFQKYKYTCCCCGAKNGNGENVILNAHHIENWKDNESKRYDVENGVALCEECHYKFHSIFGKRNNTKEQLDEFIYGQDKNIC